MEIEMAYQKKGRGTLESSSLLRFADEWHLSFSARLSRLNLLKAGRSAPLQRLSANENTFLVEY